MYCLVYERLYNYGLYWDNCKWELNMDEYEFLHDAIADRDKLSKDPDYRNIKLLRDFSI